MTRLLILSAFFAVAACSQGEDPAGPAAPAPVPPVDGETSMPGPVAGNFVGAWAARPEWCANTAGAERPIRITTTRFEGYENSCRIDEVRQMGTAYEVLRTCTGEGMTTQERVRLRVADDRMTMSWPDRAGADSVAFVRCPAASADLPPQPAPPPLPLPAPEPTG